MTATATNFRLNTRHELANLIGQYNSLGQYVSARDTIAELDCSHHKAFGIVEFACRIDAITFREALECKYTLRDIHEVQRSLRKCARLPVENGERAKHLAHLQSHSVAATAARVASLQSILHSA